MNVYELFSIGVVLIGIYVRGEVNKAKLEARVHQLEHSTNKIETLLEKLADEMHQIRLLLASNQITNK